MNKLKFIKNSLRTFQKQHLAVLLATLISAAVLTGALIVGDSVRMSLQKKVDQRLGKTTHALATADRFVRAELAQDLKKDMVTQATALLYLQGISINAEENLRLNRTQILGVEEDFWTFSEGADFNINAREVVISEEVAQELQLELGESLLLRIKNADVIPLNAPFTSDEDPSKALRLTIIGIANADQLGGFSLKNQQASSYNVFVNRAYLAEQMDLSALSNLILVADEELTKVQLQASLRKNWKLPDAALKLREIEEGQQIELLSDRIFIDPSMASKVKALPILKKEVLTYFVNGLESKGQSTPYSFVSAMTPKMIGQNLAADEIMINVWLAEDLNVKVGDPLLLKYYVIGPLRSLIEEEKTFQIKGILPMDAPQFQPDLMPDFPGLSTAGNCSEWDAGIPIDLDKIRDKDEDYWDEFRGSPKAVISVETGVDLWKNNYGNYTAIRFDGAEISQKKLEALLLSSISPEDVGAQFLDVRAEGQRAASNGVDFGELFLSLSFFVIAAAILLMVLIYRLNMESRMSEVGVLYALGYSRKQILRLRMAESLPTIIVGSILGGLGGILYNKWMIWGLNGVWNQAVHANMLEAFILPKTIVIGLVISMLIALLSIFLVMNKMLKKPVISVIREQEPSMRMKKRKMDLWIASLGTLSALAILIYAASSAMMQNTSLMLMAGFFILIGLTAFVSVLLKHMGSDAASPIQHQWQLALINARRNRGRSLAVVALLALGTFTIIITGANRKTFSGTEEDRSSGTGGYQFWAETTVPILQDLNTEEGREAQGLFEEQLFHSTSFVQFQSLAGDDASCLNLNQVQQPQILGVDAALFDSLGAFSFANTLVESTEPWLELESYGQNHIIPAIADQTVIQWGLMKKVGDTLTYFDEAGQALHLVLVGGLNASIFQGNILISKEAFRQHFPSAAGSSYMLIEGEPAQMQELKQLLSNDLSDYGIEITEASTRLATFYSVTNTYLSIFMILGALGVLLGTIGLGIILMRNMLERSKELLLLHSIGFRRKQIFHLVLVENIFLLLLGMLIGIIAAFIGILPSLLSPAFHIPSQFLFVLVLAVFLSGCFWIYISAWRVLK